jgi:hypothetical protein
MFSLAVGDSDLLDLRSATVRLIMRCSGISELERIIAQ